ncbi:MAG: WD40 repeat domain-containing protein [Gemmataceae bacterium]
MSAFSCRFAALFVLASALIGVGAASPAEPSKKTPPRLDLFGDPLPPGAVARLGTMRLRYAACMAFSPDGKVVATAQHHAVHLWDAATGKHLRRLSCSSVWAYTVAFSPDGRKVAIHDNLGIDIVVWQVDKESPLFTKRIKREGGVHQLVMARIVFSPDSKTLYTGNDQTIHGWEAATGKQTYRFQHSTEKETRVDTIVFSRDGKLFATAGGRNGLVHLWDTHAGKLLHVFGGHKRYVRCAAFSPDSNLLATGLDDWTVRLWDVKSGKEVRKVESHPGEIVAVAFTPDGKELATANRQHMFAEDTIRLWDLKAGVSQLRKTIAAPGVEALEYFPDGKTLAWICCKQSVRLLDATTGEERMLFDSHYGDLNSVAYSPNGHLIATASSDYTVRLWEADTGKPKGVLRGHTDKVNALAFSPDGKWLASASWDGTAILWDVEKKKTRFQRLGANGIEVQAVAFAPDGKTLVIGGCNYTESWDVRTGTQLRTINIHGKEYEDVINALAFSADGKLLASGGKESVRLHDARNGQLLRIVRSKLWVTSLAFSPDGRTLASGCNKHTILWELASCKQRARLPGHRNERGALAFSPDGKLLASGSHNPGGDMNKVVHVWHLATGKELGAFRGHEQPVFGVAFSPDGKRLATASGDATTLIWDLAAVAARGPHPRFDKRSVKSPLDAKDLETAWNDLTGDDAVKAQQAIWMLAREPRQAMAFLRQHLRPADKPDAARIKSLISDLDSDNFSTREQASAELTRLGTSAEMLLRKKHAEKVSLEMRKRIELVLEKLEVLAPLSGEELRHVRAVEALEQSGTHEARQLLRTLAKGSECARLTRETKASLQRLDRHPCPSP